MNSYEEMRRQNLLQRQEMLEKIGLKFPIQNAGSPVSTAKKKTGRPPKKRVAESMDEDGDDEDDNDWPNSPVTKKRKRRLGDGDRLYSTKNTSHRSNEDLRRYPKRDTSASRPIHKSTYIPGSDDMLYCADCKSKWKGDCPEHGPLLVIPDTPVPPNLSDKSRAKNTAPPSVTVADSKIPGAGRGVWAREYIPARVRFGPYGGKIVSTDVRNEYTWLVRKNGRAHHCIDATEPGISNWMRFVNCARYDGEQNLEAFQYGGDIYYRTLRRIAPHEELLVWYGDDYGRQLGIDPEICDAEDEGKWKEMRFKCVGCLFSFISPLYLEKHKKVCRQLKALEKPAQTYQCPGCKYLFSGAEYLTRHERFCRKLLYCTSTSETCITKEESTVKVGTKKPETFTLDKVEEEEVKINDLNVEDSRSVDRNEERERRPSSAATLDRGSEEGMTVEVTNLTTGNRSKVSTETRWKISNEDQFDSSTAIQSKVSTGNQSEDLPIPTVVAKTKLMEIKQPYVCLERIFLDERQTTELRCK